MLVKELNNWLETEIEDLKKQRLNMTASQFRTVQVKLIEFVKKDLELLTKEFPISETYYGELSKIDLEEVVRDGQ